MFSDCDFVDRIKMPRRLNIERRFKDKKMTILTQLERLDLTKTSCLMLSILTLYVITGYNIV